MGMLDKAKLVRRVCSVFFLLDTSGSMSGSPIGSVNAALEGVLPELISLSNDNADIEIKIAVMTFDTGIRWATGSGLVAPEKYAWNDLDAGGGTAMGAAFRELNKVLSQSRGYMNEASGSVAPVLFLLTDGEPTDDYQEALKALKENPWYKIAARVAIGYGDSNDAVLQEFTGNSETVLHTNEPKELMRLIRFVTVTSAMVNSNPKGTDSQNTPGDPNDMTNAVAAKIQAASPTLLADTDEEW